METDIRAYSKNVHISPQKVRLVVDLVRGRYVLDALNILRFTNRPAAKEVSKVISSAMANGEENLGVSRDDMFIHKIYADHAPTRKWRRFGARGRFKPWLRRASHITVILREREE